MRDLFARVEISRRRFVERLAGGAFAAASLLSFPKGAAAQVPASGSPAPSTSLLPSLSPGSSISPSLLPSPTPSPSPSFLPSPTPPPTPSSTPPPSPSLPSKVTICHRGHTIEVSLASLAQHLAHGDTLGPCKDEDDDEDEQDDEDEDDDGHGQGGDDHGG